MDFFFVKLMAELCYWEGYKEKKEKNVTTVIYFKLYFEFSHLSSYLEFTNKMFEKRILLEAF